MGKPNLGVMVRVGALLIAVGALAACGSSVAAPGPARPATATCGPSGGRTLSQSPRARIYARGGVVYGCAAGSGRQVRLGSPASCVRADRVQAVAVAGTLAALALQRCGVDMAAASIMVIRLSDGRRLYGHAAASPAGPEALTSVASIVAGSTGMVAWIARSSSIASHHSLTVLYARSGSGVRRLDQGGQIGALRLTGQRLDWTHAGSRRSATLG